MNILYLTEFFPVRSEEITGGVEARSFFLVKELDKHNKFLIISSRIKDQPEQSCEFTQVKIFRCGNGGDYLHDGGLWQRYKFFKAGLKKAKELAPEVDIIEASGWLGYIIAMHLKKIIKKPFIITYHEVWIGQWKNLFGISGKIGEYFERKILKQNWNKIIAVSEQTKLALEKQGIPENKISVIHNGVDNKEIYSAEIKKYEKPTVVVVSRLVKYKRVADVISAIKILNNKVDLKIIGNGPELKTLKESAENLPVEFFGHIKSHDDLIKEIKKSHILIFPSEKEGFGIVIIEAAKSGTPFIVSDIPVFKEVTKNGKGGLIYKVGDCQDLADKINNLITDKKVYQNKAEEAKELSQDYNWTKIADKMEEEYKKCA
ncbi:glycosyltransferase family 4 protein [Patescibacteria group bacterium]|nr:glycosyltransferase family 4 protein [Patescibacteria group bacterium]MBU1673233.1 glycosyltransferase family 4 protein [Patescibacteria group bacterium]MBU1964009.1 glycosyltransferase family 4 protein [Patescibacteria group bacterium]